MRLINADALKEQIQLAPYKNGETWYELYESVIYEINNAPTINKCDNCDLMLKEKTKDDSNTNTNPV